MPKLASKFFQDPVYGAIRVDSGTLLKLIDTRAVQRLKHIRQLGTSFFTFLGAEHSRFSHSLGCLHLMGVVLQHLEREDNFRLSSGDKEIAQITALLHDIGHCAFSHTLEGVLGYKHEHMTVRLVLEDPQIKQILGERAKLVAAIISGQAKGRVYSAITSLISSQLDVDRLDYLVRDAHYTGVNSGTVDVERIISSFSLRQGELAVKGKGSLAVEEYFLARYFMYWKVYFHKTSRCLELILKALLKRAKDLHSQKRLEAASLTPALKQFFEQGERVTVKMFLDHDDSDVLVGIKAWQYGEDSILADLSRRFLNRQKYKLLKEARDLDEVLSPRQVQKIRDYFESKMRGSSEYYFFEDRFGNLPYDPEHPVYLLLEDGNKEELSKRSVVIQGVMKKLVHARYYVPHEEAGAIQPLLT